MRGETLLEQWRETRQLIDEDCSSLAVLNHAAGPNRSVWSASLLKL
jgi:hypothetical protein